MKSGGKITGIAWCLHEDIRFVYLCRPYFIVAALNDLVIFIIHYYNTDYLFSKGEGSLQRWWWLRRKRGGV